MYVLSLEITKNCNLNCKYCYVDRSSKKNIKSDIAQKALDLGFREALKQKDKTLCIYFIGGEPLTAYDTIERCVLYAENANKEYGLTLIYSITTNALLLNESIINFFKKYRFELKISIDGNKEIHDLNRCFINGLGSYDLVVSKLNLIKEYEEFRKVPVHAAHVLTRNNKGSLTQTLNHLRELGFSYIETDINLEEEWKPNDIDELLIQMGEAFQYYINSRNRQELWHWKYYDDFLEAFSTQGTFYQCKSGLVSIFVNVRGKIYPCLETDRHMEIGDVQKGLDVEKIRKLVNIQSSKNETCLKCEEYKDFKCRACSCMIVNYLYSKDIYAPPAIKCEVTKFIHDYFRKRYSEEQIVLLGEHYSRRRKIVN